MLNLEAIRGELAKRGFTIIEEGVRMLNRKKDVEGWVFPKWLETGFARGDEETS